jgi:hypothetical protein
MSDVYSYPRNFPHRLNPALGGRKPMKPKLINLPVNPIPKPPERDCGPVCLHYDDTADCIG